MNFFASIKVCYAKYFKFSGRASRSEFWYFWLFLVIVGVLTSYIDAVIKGISYSEYINSGEIGIVEMLSIFINMLPSITVVARRLHDVNRSGWWMLIPLTIVGIIPYLYWLCKRGDEEENSFGAT